MYHQTKENKVNIVQHIYTLLIPLKSHILSFYSFKALKQQDAKANGAEIVLKNRIAKMEDEKSKVRFKNSIGSDVVSCSGFSLCD